MARQVHLVGSVPLADARAVFTTVSAALGPRLKRIPDGETGERSDWITWLEPAFAENPALEKSDELFRVHATGTARIRYRLQAGQDGQGRALRQSVLCRHRQSVIRGIRRAQARRAHSAREVRFQIDLVPAHSVIWLFLQDDLHPPLDPVYNEALKREIDKIAAALPHERDRDPVRRRLGGVRAAAAQRAERLRQGPRRDAGDVRRAS